MSVQWTERQQQVIRHRDGNVLAAAAAGSGKTAVLVERILQMVMDPENPVPIDRMLIVTFTNAAAAQMKEKIRNRLQQACEADPTNVWLQEQLDRMAQTSIMTIHAFCLQVVRDYITRIPELDPGFRVADETETELLRSDVLSKVLEACYLQWEADPEENQDFITFVDSYGGARQDVTVEELLLRVYDFARSLPNPMRWLTESVEAYGEESYRAKRDSLWYDCVCESMLQHQKAAIVYFEQGLRYINAEEDKVLLEGEDIREQIDELLSYLRYIPQDENFRNMDLLAQQIFAASKLPRLRYPFESQEKKDYLKKQLLDKGVQELEQALKFYQDFMDEEDMKRMFCRTYPALKGMQKVLQAFDTAYQNAKTEQNILEFSDFEHFALRILRERGEGAPTKVAEDLREQYEYIFIDEYQDSNPIQELILTSIARTSEEGQCRNMFMVGDVKQSIYRFRHADPSLFMKKYETYGHKKDTARYQLNQNFRSRPEVLQSINSIFQAIMSRSAGELAYTEEEQLNPGAKFPPSFSEERVQLQVFACEPGIISEKRFDIEADWIAEDIENRLRMPQMVWDGEKLRPAEPRDIVILLRAVAGRSGAIKKRLEARHIDCYAESDVNFFDTSEVRLVLQILQILDNPHQDIPLVGVLYSPIFRFTANELAQLRLMAPEEEYWTALQRGREAEDPTLRAKVCAFLDQIEDWRDRAIYESMHDLLWQIYQESGYYLYASAMPEGELRRANLDLLLEKSVEFEEGMYSGLFQFLRFVEKLETRQKQMDEAKTLGEGDQVVRIMSIHKSKGLEFPIVYVAGMGSQFNQLDTRAPLILHSEWGIGAMAIEPENYLRYPTLIRKLISEKVKQENVSEEIRVLYVAMTRAKETLILSGARTIDSQDNITVYPEFDWVMPSSQVLRATSYLKWVEETVKHRFDTGIQYDCHYIEDSKETEPPIHAASEEAREERESLSPAESFDWTYPYRVETQMGVRFSVSEIKQRLQPADDEEEETISLLPPAGAANGAHRGTAMHAFLANASFEELHTDAEVEEQIQKLLQKGILEEEEAAMLYRKELLGFGRSALCGRMQKADRLWREQPFILSLSLPEFSALCPGWLSNGAESSDSRIMIQGIIDCFFEEEGEVVLVDYKTDRTLDAARKEQYEQQLRIYQTAIERTTGHKVREKILYLTRNGESILCE